MRKGGGPEGVLATIFSTIALLTRTKGATRTSTDDITELNPQKSQILIAIRE